MIKTFCHFVIPDGIQDRDKDKISSILHAVSSFSGRDNKFSLAKHAFNEVKQDWKFYSDTDKDVLKRFILDHL